MKKMRAARKRRDTRYRQVTAVRDRAAGDGQIFFACPDCGKAVFTTRGAARRFARRNYPGTAQVPYLACDGVSFHLTSQDARARQWWREHRESRDQDAG